MKRLLIALLVFTSASWADTLQERLEDVQAVVGVDFARSTAPVSIPGWGELYIATIEWYVVSGTTITNQSSELIVFKAGVVGEEAAYWFPRVPTILQPEVKFLSSRTTGGWASQTRAQQLAAIESFCNTKYRTIAANAGDIKGFTVTPVNGSTILVQGEFNVNANAEWEARSYYIRLVDPNGATTGANVEFQRKL